MKHLPFIAVLIFLSSCTKQSVFVWTISDVIGLSLLALFLLAALVIWILIKIDNRKRRKC
jgi:hypothetical protein